MATLLEDAQTRRELSVRSSQRAARFDWPRVWIGIWRSTATLSEPSTRRWPRRRVQNASEAASSNEQSSGKALSVRVANSDANLRNFPTSLLSGRNEQGQRGCFTISRAIRKSSYRKKKSFTTSAH